MKFSLFPLLCLTVCLLFIFPAYGKKADNQEAKWDTNTAFTYYYDSREFGTLNILTSAKGLPMDLFFWGFTDFHGDHQSDSGPTDFTRYFMEYRLLKGLDPEWTMGIDGLGLIAEYNDMNGPDNNLARFGLYHKLAYSLPWENNGWWQTRIYPYETDGEGWQISTSYFVPFTSELSLGGFADINFIENGKDRWVIEPQLTYKMTNHLSLALEYRYNGYEDANPTVKGSGAALGLEVSF